MKTRRVECEKDERKQEDDILCFSGTEKDRVYHTSALYSPWYTWAECARDFLDASDVPAKLQPFVNTVLGEVWEDRSGEVMDTDSLYNKREDYPIVPRQAVLLTCGIDVQPDRLELELVAWGRGEESWNIDYQIIAGDPSSGEVWELLDEYLKQRWPHPAFEDGMRIMASCIDTGGSNTQSVYNFVRPREGRRIWGIKGYAGSRPVWPRRPSRNNKGKINLYIVGVDAAKDVITARFKKAGAGASGVGATHFHIARDREYFEQLTSERKVTRFYKGFKKISWEKGDHSRNEALDCRVYAYAALQGLLSGGVSLNRQASMVENRLTERGIDIIKAAPVENEETMSLPLSGGEEDNQPPSPAIAPMSRKKKKRRVASISSFMR